MIIYLMNNKNNFNRSNEKSYFTNEFSFTLNYGMY